MAFYENQRTKYDVPLSHLDHKYIPQCKDVKELEKILKVLRSGTEGTFPDLEKLTEDQIQSLDPDNKLLRKSGKPLLPGELDEEERKELEEYIECWVEESKEKEKNLTNSSQNILDEFPPVRNADTKISSDKSEENYANTQKSSQKRVKPRDYKEWDRFDIEAELNKAEERNDSSEGQTTSKTKSDLPESISGSGLSDELKETKANYERNKGNEAFKAGDFDESIVYYCRSISLLPTAAAYNNRALVYLKQKKWNKALDDCNTVLALEPDNLKAILRRASAYQGLTRYPQAKKDLETVLNKEPSNKSATSILKEVDKALADQKVTGRRMKIEEVDDSSTEKTPSDEQEAMQNNMESVENSATDGTHETKDATTEKTAAEMDLQNHKEKSKEHSEKAKKSPEKEKPSAEKDVTGKGVSEPNATRADEKVAVDASSKTAASTEKSTPVEALSRPNSDAVAGDSDVSSAPPPPLEKNVLALKDAGNELFRTGQYADALHKYDLAIKKIPDDEKRKHALNVSVLYSNRAACKLKIGDCRGCVEDCDEAVKYYPCSPKPYLRRAMAYEQLERFQEAFVDYKQALNAGINSEVAQQGSDRCASMLQQMNGSRWREKLPKIASFSSFAGLIPTVTTATVDVASSGSSSEKDAETLFEKDKTEGNKLFAKGEYTKAIDCFTKCIELFSDRVVPYTNRALCYLKLGKCDDVLNDCNQALSIEFHNVKALYRRALAYKMLEKYEESLIDLETILKLDPSNTAAKKELRQVTQCKEKMQEKKAQFACLREQQKLRQRIKIQEVESSSEEEEETGRASSSMPKVNPPHSRTPAEDKETLKDTHTPLNRPAESKKDPGLGSKSASSLKLPKVTPYAFLQAWKSLKFSEDINSYATLLDQVQPQDLSKVISSSLDGEFLLNLVRCTKSFVKNGRATRAFDYLQHLVKVPRFDMVMMFMSDSDKKDIGNIFDLLGERSNEGINSDLLAQTRNKYGV